MICAYAAYICARSCSKVMFAYPMWPLRSDRTNMLSTAPRMICLIDLSVESNSFYILILRACASRISAICGLVLTVGLIGSCLGFGGGKAVWRFEC